MTQRRIALGRLVRVVAALALAGCGAGASAQTTPKPLVKFPDLGYKYIPPRLPAGLPTSTPVVVDLTNAGLVHPASMQLASDSSFSGATWTGWGSASATGHGVATIRICSPSCGGGHDARYQATVVLSSLKTCNSHRFYESAQVTLDTVAGPKPWGAVLRRPC